MNGWQRSSGRDESFSKAIDRLITEVGEAHTGADIRRSLTTIESLSEDDVQAFLSVISDSRASESWVQHDLRNSAASTA